MVEFIKGMDLSRMFFFEKAKPVLDREYPELIYSAGLLGYGSDVLGYDDITSTDHMWGPRFYLFLQKADIGLKEKIEKSFSNSLPYTYKGYSVHFSKPDEKDNGIRHAEYIGEGEISPLIFIQTVEEFLEEYLGKKDLDSLEGFDWLAFSEHKLLALTAGDMFVDMLDIHKVLDKIKVFPDHVKYYLIASDWAVISEEQAFVKRTGARGDEIGSSIICARIADRLMHLCFLYCNRYAPYSKWFGTAFWELPINTEIREGIQSALQAGSAAEREMYIVKAQAAVAGLHNKMNITEMVNAAPQNYFGRDIQVIYADRIAGAVSNRLRGTVFEGLPLIGSLSHVGNLTALTEKGGNLEPLKSLYRHFVHRQT